MAANPVVGSPASENELVANIYYFGAGTAVTKYEVPLMSGTVGTPDKNYERSPVLKPNRQGGDQIGGTTGASGTLNVPVIDEEIFRKLMESMFFASAVTSAADPTWLLRPGSTRKPFWLELIYKHYNATGGSVLTYEYLKGAEPGRCNITIPNTGAATAQFDLLGTSYTVTSAQDTNVSAPTSTTALAGAVPMASTTSGALCAFYAEGLTGTGDELGAESASLTIDNNMELKFRIGSANADHVSIGDFDVTANITAYYRGSNIQSFYANETRKGYRFITKAAGANARYSFDIPRMVPTGAPKGTSGQTITEQGNLFAEYHSSISAKMQIRMGTGDLS